MAEGEHVMSDHRLAGLRELLSQSRSAEWFAADVRDRPVFVFNRIQQAQIRHLASTLDDRAVMQLPREDLRDRLSSLAVQFGCWEHEIEHGVGWMLLRSFPLDLGDLRAIKRAYLAIGRCLGTPVSQTHAGNALGEVEDRGKDAQDPTVRGHQTNAELPFHCDRCDVVGLLCVRNGARGGRSQLACAPAVLRTLIDEHPAIALRLFKPLPHDRRGEQLADEESWVPLEIFSFVQGRFVSRYIRRFIESAARFGPLAQLTAESVADLDVLDAILAQPGRAVEMDFKPGDLQLVNNYTVWHARTAYEDSATDERRLLLRLWLSSPLSRALPATFKPLYGAIGAGELRGGVPPTQVGAFN